MANALLVLMWKHLMVRARRFVHTPIELCSTILFFLFLFSIRYELAPEPQSHRHGEKVIHQQDPYSLDNVSPFAVLYTPDTEQTRVLMDLVAEKLRIVRTDSVSLIKTRKGFLYGFSDYEPIKPIVTDELFDGALVIFHGFGNETEGLPRRLNYTLRMNGYFATHTIESFDDRVTPHEQFGTMYEKFMKLQWAIDSSYLELQDVDVDKKILTLQEFPFESKGSDGDTPFVVVICALMTLVCYVSLTLPFIFLMVRLLEERASGIQELIKMIGVSLSTLGISHILNALPTGLMYSIGGAILLTCGRNPLIPLSSPFLIFVALFLHYMTVVALAFACSYIANSSQYAVSLAVVMYLASWMPNMLMPKHVSQFVKLLSGFLPHEPILLFWNHVSYFETNGVGLNFGNMWHYYSKLGPSVAACFALMVAQAVILFMLTWYLSVVRPGKHGTALPWNFLCQAEFWRKNKISNVIDDAEEVPMDTAKDHRYFEELPSRAEVGISISNVTKVYHKKKALNNVSFDVLKGEITVLLGHNGAGKTTLMSIITGLTSATEGKVTVNGLDSVSHQTEVRKQLGLCTQHNLFFPDLTVLQHVMFFAMLKGTKCAHAEKSSRELLDHLGIEDKANSQSNELSGGMKRRLQLACALSGGADVLILDEPTSGLDVKTRRELWNLLLSLRGTRTVLLTTHFMEEADALGDRVACLYAGLLRAHATPIYLKKNMGTGYRLSFTTVGLPNEPAITQIVTSYVPDATLKETGLNSISYSLPASDSKKFPKLFSKLETMRPELGIDTIGVGVSTLEEVFVRLCSDVNTTFTEDALDGALPEHTYTRMTGFTLCYQQVLTLAKRQILYILSKKISFVLMQILLPVSMMVVFTWASNGRGNDTAAATKSLPMDLDMYSTLDHPKVFYKVDEPAIIERITKNYSRFTFVPVEDISSAALRTVQKDLFEYKNYLNGIELSGHNATIHYSTVVRHAAPTALNLLSNALAARLPWADGRTIQTYNEPLSPTTRYTTTLTDSNKVYEPKSTTDIYVWVFFMVFIVLGTAMNCVTLPIKERLAGTRHIHIMSGCPPYLHWLTTLLLQAIIYSVFLIIPSMIGIKFMETTSTLNRPDFLGALFLILLLGIMSFLAFAYLTSFVLNERVAGITLTTVVLIFGIFPGGYKTNSDIEGYSVGKWKIPLTLTGVLMPPHAMTGALYRAAFVARLGAYCDLNRHLCPKMIRIIELVEKGFDGEKCCAGQSQSGYFCFDPYSPLRDIIIMFAQTAFYMVLVLLTQRGIFNSVWDHVANLRYRPPAPLFRDAMVQAEKTYVDKCIKLPVSQIPDAMLVHDVNKNYNNICRQHNAVKGISFSVKNGECFGILGVNGAGKSTTFSMITGEQCATRGKIFANYQFLKWPRDKYLQSLGYCPQFFGLDDFLTGRQNLQLVLTLRGLNSEDVANEVNSWIDVVGLDKYMDQRVWGYSGGCVRRLAAAAALAQGARVTLLDEPTAGVDVAARRRVWAALRRGLAQGRAVIITSHSLDEMEALCDRIAIMAAGELCALGAPPRLRAAHAAGHALHLKLADPADATDGASGVSALKGALHETFDCTLKDEHKTMLHFHINETMQYSDLFGKLETLKENYPNIIEDYSVTETTLEEVFLSFAKGTQRQNQSLHEVEANSNTA